MGNVLSLDGPTRCLSFSMLFIHSSFSLSTFYNDADITLKKAKNQSINLVLVGPNPN